MAKTKKEGQKKTKLFEIRVTDNPDCCEVGAGGIQFAHGKAELGECPLLGWYREHEGYEVIEKGTDPAETEEEAKVEEKTETKNDKEG